MSQTLKAELHTQLFFVPNESKAYAPPSFKALEILAYLPITGLRQNII